MIVSGLFPWEPGGDKFHWCGDIGAMFGREAYTQWLRNKGITIWESTIVTSKIHIKSNVTRCQARCDDGLPDGHHDHELHGLRALLEKRLVSTRMPVFLSFFLSAVVILAFLSRFCSHRDSRGR